jgi:indolepyruvate ferredoxin oxidoreductase beta subunit
MMRATTNVLVVGVGGQGVLMVSRALTHLCQESGLKVKQSEVHGMAKRGGVVFSHVRFGREVWSPTIPEGEADVLLALEWAEAVRWLPHLRPREGILIADTQRLVPPFACRDRRPGALCGYAPETVEEILARVETGHALDATGMAKGLGNARVANSLLLGVLSTVPSLDFPLERWLQVLDGAVPDETRTLNRTAFERGREWVESPVLTPPKIREHALPESSTRRSIELEIHAAWCKGCDICVKMCPERCLRLDERRVAVLVDPNACTGCRICEMLCPDFAINVHVRQMEATR